MMSPAFAYGLPPKVVEQTYSSVNLPVRAAAQVEVLSASPVLHGALVSDPSGTGVWTLNGDGSRLVKVGPAPEKALEKKTSEKPVEAEARENIFERNRASGAFHLGPDRLAFRPEPQMEGDFWSVPLGFEPLGLAAHPATGWLTGWGAYPARLLAFPPDRRTLLKLNWTADSEPVYFAPCDARRAILVENLKSGQSRVVFFENARPRELTYFDFSQDKLLSTATAAVVRSCDEFFVAGSFGVARVRYGKQL